MTKLKDLKARFMEDPEFREEYARIDGEYALIEALVRARTAAKPTQAEFRHDAVGGRAAGGRAGAAVLRHAAPLRRGDRHAADGGPGAGRRLSPGEGGRPVPRVEDGPPAIRMPGAPRGPSGGRRGLVALPVEEVCPNAVGDGRPGRRVPR